MVDDHNQAVGDLEEYLVKYLKGGHVAKSRPTLKKGGFLGLGGQKMVGSTCSLLMAISSNSQDAIDYLAKEINFLRQRIDAKRQAIDSLLRQERRARKGGKLTERIEGENYGPSELRFLP